MNTHATQSLDTLGHKLGEAALTLLVALSGPVRAETTIVFATHATWPPMEMVNDQKQVVGYSIDYMTAAGKEAGFTPVFKNTAWDGIFAGLSANKYDAIVSSVSITEERKKAWTSASRTTPCVRP